MKEDKGDRGAEDLAALDTKAHPLLSNASALGALFGAADTFREFMLAAAVADRVVLSGITKSSLQTNLTYETGAQLARALVTPWNAAVARLRAPQNGEFKGPRRSRGVDRGGVFGHLRHPKRARIVRVSIEAERLLRSDELRAVAFSVLARMVHRWCNHWLTVADGSDVSKWTVGSLLVSHAQWIYLPSPTDRMRQAVEHVHLNPEDESAGARLGRLGLADDRHILFNAHWAEIRMSVDLFRVFYCVDDLDEDGRLEAAQDLLKRRRHFFEGRGYGDKMPVGDHWYRFDNTLTLRTIVKALVHLRQSGWRHEVGHAVPGVPVVALSTPGRRSIAFVPGEVQQFASEAELQADAWGILRHQFMQRPLDFVAERLGTFQGSMFASKYRDVEAVLDSRGAPREAPDPDFELRFGLFDEASDEHAPDRLAGFVEHAVTHVPGLLLQTLGWSVLGVESIEDAAKIAAVAYAVDVLLSGPGSGRRNVASEDN